MARVKTLSLFVSVLAVAAWVGVSFVRPQALVAILDVGQGDAIFITTSSGEDILIDGGNNTAVLEHLGGLLPVMDRDIELMILTHPHADHVNGLIDVVERYDVQRIMCACDGGDSNLFEIWEELASGDTLVENIHSKQEITFSGGAKITVWAPPVDEDDMNAQSLIALFEDQGQRFLLTGDAEEPSEQWLLEQGVATDIDVLKVGHHGSRNGTSTAFLQAFTPEDAVISSGTGNRYKHPHAELLERLAREQVQTWRTDTHGTVLFWLFNGQWHRSTMHDRLMPLIADLWYNEAT